MTRAYDNAVDARYPSGRRNLIINGAMQVAQRSTSVTGQTANGYYTLDRWRQVASGATFDSSQQTLTLGQSDIPSQFRYFQRFNVTSGGDNCGPQTRIEDVNQFDGTQVTLSFYAKGTNPGGGHITVLFDQVFGSGGSTTVSLSEDVTLTSSWQRFAVTKTLGSLSGKTVGTSSYLNVKFNQPSDDNTTDAWSIDFTGVQLEYGNVATPFEHRSYGEELALCQRYYEKCGIVNGSRTGTNLLDGYAPFKVVKRSTGYSYSVDTSGSDEVALPGQNSKSVTNYSSALAKTTHGFYPRFYVDSDPTSGGSYTSYESNEYLLVDDEL